MPNLPPIGESCLEAICRALGDTDKGLTGGQIGELLARGGIADPLPGMTKWRRLFEALRRKQGEDGCANGILGFLKSAMDPVRFVGRTPAYEDLLARINEPLAFCGLVLRTDGSLALRQGARTLSEAQGRAARLRTKLEARGVHHDVLAYCRAELLHENYFHAVFEATKSVAEKLRARTGLSGDGADLVDRAFGLASPLLAINTLRTETEQSEQKGFATLVKGMFGVFRNVTAHAPKVIWPIGEQDALDLLSLVSYIHRRLDASADVTARGGSAAG